MPYRDLQRPPPAAPTERVRWVPREPPLAPAAVVGLGDAARALARRLLRLDDARLGALQGVAGPSLVAVVGTADALPWVDGAVYLGRDPAASTLYLPTALRPDVHAALFERALLGGRSIEAPVAVVTRAGELVVFSLGAARAVSRAELVRQAEG